MTRSCQSGRVIPVTGRLEENAAAAAILSCLLRACFAGWRSRSSRPPCSSVRSLPFGTKRSSDAFPVVYFRNSSAIVSMIACTSARSSFEARRRYLPGYSRLARSQCEHDKHAELFCDVSSGEQDSARRRRRGAMRLGVRSPVTTNSPRDAFWLGAALLETAFLSAALLRRLSPVSLATTTADSLTAVDESDTHV